MSDSIKDQLVALGLAKAETTKAKTKRAGAGKKKPRKRKKPGSGNSELSLDAAYRMRAKEEKESAAEKKRKKQEEDRLRRRVNAEIQKIVDVHALNDKTAELKRNFLYKGRIRSVLVTAEQLKSLNAGELGLVFLRGSYFVMAPEHVEAVRAISADHVPDLGADDQDDADEEFPVPDDLTW